MLVHDLSDHVTKPFVDLEHVHNLGHTNMNALYLAPPTLGDGTPRTLASRLSEVPVAGRELSLRVSPAILTPYLDDLVNRQLREVVSPLADTHVVPHKPVTSLGHPLLLRSLLACPRAKGIAHTRNLDTFHHQNLSINSGTTADFF